MLGGIQGRRSALRQLAGAGAALVSLARADLGLAAGDDVLAEGCRLTGERCKRNNNCCSGSCKRHRKKHGKNDKGKNKREGKCKCLGNNKKCKKDAACCKGYCDQKENRCKCTPANQTCNKDSDCCSSRKCVSNGNTRVCKKHKR
jgi:hypothetical protein